MNQKKLKYKHYSKKVKRTQEAQALFNESKEKIGMKVHITQNNSA